MRACSAILTDKGKKYVRLYSNNYNITEFEDEAKHYKVHVISTELLTYCLVWKYNTMFIQDSKKLSE